MSLSTLKLRIFKYFFKNESYAGWKNIANSLLETGECVVAGDKCIWIGGIGNFIKTETAEGYFGCIKYIFDLNNFLSSCWFIQIYVEYLKLEKEKIDVLVQNYNEILNLQDI